MFFRRSIQVGDMLPQPPVLPAETEVIYTTGIYSKDSGFYNVMEHGKNHDESDIVDDLAILLDDGIGKKGRERIGTGSRIKAKNMVDGIKRMVKALPRDRMGELCFSRETVEANLEIRIYAERRLV